MAKQPSRGERRRPIDPSTADMLDDIELRDKRRTMTKRERAEKDRAKERLKRRVNWDLPVDLKEKVKTVAKKEGIPESSLAAWLIFKGFASLGETPDEWHEALDVYKETSGSPRFEWVLDIDKLMDEES